MNSANILQNKTAQAYYVIQYEEMLHAKHKLYTVVTK